jgi:hypothetical protein
MPGLWAAFALLGPDAEEQIDELVGGPAATDGALRIDLPVPGRHLSESPISRCRRTSGQPAKARACWSLRRPEVVGSRSRERASPGGDGGGRPPAARPGPYRWGGIAPGDLRGSVFGSASPHWSWPFCTSFLAVLLEEFSKTSSGIIG